MDTAVARFKELSLATQELHERGLTQAAKWAAEQMIGLPANVVDNYESLLQRDMTRSPAEEQPQFILAKLYFESKEYRRAAKLLSNVGGVKALFLRCYALYLAGEKRKEEERVEKAGPLGKADVVNQELDALESELASAISLGQADGFIYYLMGLILTDKERTEDARDMLIKSVTDFPCNWAAWQALQSLCTDMEHIATLPLPQHWMRECFLASLCLELQHNAECLSRLQMLAQVHTRSQFVLLTAASAHYNMRNFDEAQELFEDVQLNDPYIIQGMDIYSNILFVKEQFAALSHLAHHCSLTDKYRPETCCIIGNYYSARRQHEKAVEYFRRALKLDRNYLSAWTLMGHEYVEMKNPNAAIEAYRRVVDTSPRDYRAWYGLGQMYEFLVMPYYALYYYRRATALRPYDARMWCAMGQCYESSQLKMDEAAIRCYQRAYKNDDREGIALPKLAKLHAQRQEKELAFTYYRLNLERLDSQQASGQDVADALLYMATYLKDQAAFAEAEQYCSRLLDHGGQYKEKAKALLREIRNLDRHSAGTAAGKSLAASSYTTPVASSHPAPAPTFSFGSGASGSSEMMEEVVGGMDPGMVQLVAEQASVSAQVAAAALRQADGNPVAAVANLNNQRRMSTS